MSHPPRTLEVDADADAEVDVIGYATVVIRRPTPPVARFRRLHLTGRAALGIVLLMSILLGGSKAKGTGLHDDRLGGCPKSPNCVSSQAEDFEHRIDPFELVGAPAEAWKALHDVVAELPRTTVIRDDPTYLHAECRSLIFRFVDDLEFQLLESEGRIAVRSASRVGHSDLGVNRRRAEEVRAQLARRGVVAPD